MTHPSWETRVEPPGGAIARIRKHRLYREFPEGGTALFPGQGCPIAAIANQTS
ncbi:hypothetical protein [Phormidium sp. CCY1219]|uniref:hypothetical protein n=1 Tax=Phormidium sp. CCY1219 TaxID=2886104 RepID=UPI002D1F2E35|nr:hypothetical protein [Phormidium sp. CCY1219]MEB3829942.1 hypothetical protein [Phormidium sp. CCY1219]